MIGRDSRHDGGSLLRRGPVVLVLVLLLFATASYRFDLGARWLGHGGPDPSLDPAAVAPPPGLELPAVTDPALVAAPVEGAAAAGGADGGTRAPDAAKVRRVLAPLLADPDLGPRVHVAVHPLGDQQPVFTRGSGSAVPASTLKLLTTAAALSLLGPDHTFSTTVQATGARRLVLVGGGDPLLASRPTPTSYPPVADVVTLARRTAEALLEEGTRRVRLGYDDSLFTGPAVNPHWPDDYVPDGVVSPISSLWVDEGRALTGSGRVSDPSAVAAAVFAGALDRFGVEVIDVPEPRRVASGARVVAGVESAPLAQLVEHVLLVSDNEASEVLLRHVGLATRSRGSSAAGSRGVLAELGPLGVELPRARVYDGSGLSRDNRLTPDTLVGVLQAAASAEHPELRSVLTGLPVAGFTGSLAVRFDDVVPQGRGRVRAKTGTLTGVSALAGILTDRDGEAMVFVLVADRVDPADTLAARDALDAIAAALAACHCSS